VKELIVSQSRIPSLSARKIDASALPSSSSSTTTTAPSASTDPLPFTEPTDSKRSAATASAASQPYHLPALCLRYHLMGRGAACYALISAARSVSCRALDVSGSALGEDGACGMAMAWKENG
jgi:hypothetical protein